LLLSTAVRGAAWRAGCLQAAFQVRPVGPPPLLQFIIFCILSLVNV
jgi:hypothetical protein